jgi:hypothetical protein
MKPSLMEMRLICNELSSDEAKQAKVVFFMLQINVNLLNKLKRNFAFPRLSQSRSARMNFSPSPPPP